MCRIIAYTFNAAAHCPTCTSDHAATGSLTRKPPLRCETDEHGIALDLVDREGNAVRPVFSTDEHPDGIVCDQCGLVVEPPAPTAPLDAVPASFDLDQMLDGYMTCALWCTTPLGEDSDRSFADLDFTTDEVVPALREAMREDCARFVCENWQHIAQMLDDTYLESNLGHDFWLSRNGHGAGFLDYSNSSAEALQDAASAEGEVDLCITDDGKGVDSV